MGDALRDRLSDRGSIPLRSIYGTSRKDSIYAAFREFFLLSFLDIRNFFADTESDGDKMKKPLLNLKKQNTKSDYYDYNLVAVIVLLVCFGLVMLYSTSSYNAQIEYGDNVTDHDDWLIMPPLKLKKGQVYNVSFRVASVGESYPEELEVMYGSEPTAEAMTHTLMAKTKVQQLSFFRYPIFASGKSQELRRYRYVIFKNQSPTLTGINQPLPTLSVT